MNDVTPKRIKESPKTPGGISKSLLTPCRRVGLSRKWRKNGCSPFISPLSAQNTTPEPVESNKEKKRKKCDEKEHIEVNIETTKELGTSPESSICSPMSTNKSSENNDIISTPCRNIHVPRKKSKVLSLSLKNSQETDKQELDKQELDNEKQLQPSKLIKVDESKNEINVIYNKTESIKFKTELNTIQVTKEVIPITEYQKENVAKLSRNDSKSRKLSLKKSLSKSDCKSKTKEQSEPKNTIETGNLKEKSPNNLTKECIVVIQNKILKAVPSPTNKPEKASPESDSEPDVPLSTLKRKSVESVTLNTLNDDDFINKPIQKKVRNLSIKKHITTSPIDSNNTSQSSQEEPDRRTILVKKTYDKVTKPQKAKSTGSITQKDIEELKARIEIKKKLLLAKSVEDAGELKDLIKKWQKGCQNALMELLDLMKKKLPDRQNMEYAEILETLKIPAQLVGYDSENDCFITPDDTNVLMSTFQF